MVMNGTVPRIYKYQRKAKDCQVVYGGIGGLTGWCAEATTLLIVWHVGSKVRCHDFLSTVGCDHSPRQGRDIFFLCLLDVTQGVCIAEDEQQPLTR